MIQITYPEHQPPFSYAPSLNGKQVDLSEASGPLHSLCVCKHVNRQERSLRETTNTMGSVSVIAIKPLSCLEWAPLWVL